MAERNQHPPKSRGSVYRSIYAFVFLSLVALTSQLRILWDSNVVENWNKGAENFQSGKKKKEGVEYTRERERERHEIEIVAEEDSSSSSSSSQKLTPEEQQEQFWQAAKEELTRTESWKNESTFVTVDRTVYASIAKKAQTEVRSVVDNVYTGCELYIFPPPPLSNNETHDTTKPHVRFRCSSSENRNDASALRKSPCQTANLCRVVLDRKAWNVSTNQDYNHETVEKGNKTALLMMVDGMDDLTRPKRWHATLNKASYAH